MHGGTIRPTVGPGQGSTFVARLPRAGQQGPDEPSRTGDTEKNLARSAHSVVDDNEDSATEPEHVYWMMERGRRAHDARRALEAATTSGPMVILA